MADQASSDSTRERAIEALIGSGGMEIADKMSRDSAIIQKTIVRVLSWVVEAPQRGRGDMEITLDEMRALGRKIVERRAAAENN